MTTYEEFEADPEHRKLLRREELRVEISCGFYEQMEAKGITRAELARRMGVTPGFVTQILGAGRNLTLKTIADVQLALGDERIRFVVEERTGR